MSRAPFYFTFILMMSACIFSGWVGFHTHLGDSDGYDFIVAAIFPTSVSESVPPVNFERPRGFVAILKVFYLGYRAIVRHDPLLIHYHVLMAVIFFLYLFLWHRLLLLLWDRWTANLTILTLICYATLIHLSFIPVADVFAGALFALSLMLCQKFIENGRKSLGNCILIGTTLTFIALSKNQLFLFPLVFAILFVVLSSIQGGSRWQQSFRVAGDILISYVVVTDLLHRFFAHPRIGIGSYFAYLVRKNLWALHSSELTPKTVYIHDYFNSFGPLFVGMSILVLVLYFVRCRRWGNFIIKHRFTCWMGLSLSFIFIGINQAIPNREARYLFPFIPLMLASIYAASQHIARNFAPYGKPALTLLWGVILIYPIINTTQLTKGMLEKIAVAKERDLFWDNLKNPYFRNLTCKQVFTCKNDGFGFSVGAYIFHSGYFPKQFFCNFVPKSNAEFRVQLVTMATRIVRPQYCFVITNFWEGGTNLQVQKVVDVGLSEQEKTVLLKEDSEKTMSCDKETSGYTCFVVSKFDANKIR